MKKYAGLISALIAVVLLALPVMAQEEEPGQEKDPKVKSSTVIVFV